MNPDNQSSAPNQTSGTSPVPPAPMPPTTPPANPVPPSPSDPPVVDSSAPTVEAGQEQSPVPTAESAHKPSKAFLIGMVALVVVLVGVLAFLMM